MKKLIALLLAVLMLFSVAACGGNKEAAASDGAAFKIAIITGTTSQGEDEVVGAQAIQKLYGADRVLLDTYPDNFSEEVDTVIAKITQYADDADVKAIIVNQSVGGTAEAFQQIKEKRPDILCIAGTSQEDPATIAAVADIVIDNNPNARGYLMIKTAHDLGCKTFVHVSFPRHMAIESMQVRHAIMEKACAEFGMTFVDETAPDPTDTSAGGMDGAVAFMKENTPKWIEKYGQETAYFCTNDGETAPMLAALIANGGYFVEADLPSPLMGYPSALDIKVGVGEGDWDAITKTVEDAVVAAGGAGRFGTWKVSLGYSLCYGLGQYAWNYCEGKYSAVDMDDVKDIFAEALKVNFNFAKYQSPTDGVTLNNYFLIYEDTYIMGNPGYFAGNMEVEIPDWCY